MLDDFSTPGGAVAIMGVGTCPGSHSIPQKNIAELAIQLNCSTSDQERSLRALYKKSKISHRSTIFAEDTDAPMSFSSFFSQDHISGPGTDERMKLFCSEAPRMARDASALALTNASIEPSKITHLITVSCTGFTAPGLDISLINHLGLSPDVGRTNVGFMGCHGTFNAFHIAHALARQSPEEKILISSVELCSLHFSSGWNTGKVVGNSLFADGASSAVLGSPGREPQANQDWSLLSNGSHLFPDSKDYMTWNIGNHGFDISLSPKVPELIAESLRPWLVQWLDKCGYKLEDISSWAVHPGGPKILDAVESSLGLPREQTSISRDVLAQHGNMSSATLLFVLESLIKSNRTPPCVALGFGPGLVVEAALFI